MGIFRRKSKKPAEQPSTDHWETPASGLPPLVLPAGPRHANVTGVSHYQQAFRDLSPGATTLEVRPEPNNPHDRYAIAVHGPDGQKLGHFYASWAAEYCRLISSITRTHTLLLPGDIQRWEGGLGASFSLPDTGFLERWWRTDPAHRHEVPLMLATIKLAGSTKPEQQALILDRLGRADSRTVTLEFRPAPASKNRTRLDAYLDGQLVGNLTPHRANQIPDMFRRAAEGPVTLEAQLRRSSSGTHSVEIQIEMLYL